METLQSRKEPSTFMSFLLGISFACMAAGFTLACSIEPTDLGKAAVLGLVGSIVPCHYAIADKLRFRSKIVGSLFGGFYMAGLVALLGFGAHSGVSPVGIMSIMTLYLGAVLLVYTSVCIFGYMISRIIRTLWRKMCRQTMSLLTL